MAQGSFVKSGQVLFTLDRSEPGDSYLPAPILAPSNGKLAQWFVVPGHQVSAQTPVGLLVEDNFLRAKAPVALDDWQRITPQTQAQIVREGKTWKGKIISIPKAVAGGAARVEIELEIENAKAELRAGLSAEAEFTLPASRRILLPSAAILLTSDGTFVYKLEGDTAKRIPVSMRPVTLDLVEIQTPNFVPGERFIVSGFSRISPDTKVKVNPPRPESPEVRP